MVNRFHLLIFALAMTGIAVASLPRTADARIWSSECRKLLKEWKEKKGHKAFVMGTNYHDTEYCGSSWSRKSKDAAEAASLAVCKRVGATRCHVYASE